MKFSYYALLVALMLLLIATMTGCRTLTPYEQRDLEEWKRDRYYRDGYNDGFDTGSLCGSKLGYEACEEILERYGE